MKTVKFNSYGLLASKACYVYRFENRQGKRSKSPLWCLRIKKNNNKKGIEACQRPLVLSPSCFKPNQAAQ